ncbi:hypothetical protein BGZ63DRAFT_352374 [Mariannaea sp. PMI_226]|nr:hypothetical protein BGZ63DRAFT_352374 [Mariannaea sp. PMI_226]
MDGVSVAASVAGLISLGIQATQGLIEYYTAYKSQDKDVASTARNLEQLFDILETLQKQLTNRKFRPDESGVLKNIEKFIQECNECIEELKDENEKFRNRGTKSARAKFRRLAYPFRQSTLEKLDEDVKEVVRNLSLALQVLQHDGMGHIQDDIVDTKALLSLVRAEQISSATQSWLSAPDATINYNEACKKWYPGTGLWFVQGSSFSTWLSAPHSLIWLYGFAGCGKSVMCSTAIRHAYQHRKSNPRIGIAFFFFTFNNISKQDTSAMLRALVLQLSGQLDKGHELLLALQKACRGATPPDEFLLDSLLEIVKMFDDVYIFLDALDESPRETHQGYVLEALAEICEWQEPGLHILVTSRDETLIRDDLEELQCEAISMKNESVDKDIAAFISDHLKSHRRLRKWKDHHGQIEEVLTQRAQGVFRWVECQFKALEMCPESEDLLERLLYSLPRSLDETYERMLSNIPLTSLDYAQRLLTLLCCSRRPLKVSEVIDGIAVELGDDPKLNRKRRLRDVHSIHKLCPGLVEADLNLYNDETTLRIAHYSVQEYLESERISQCGAANFTVKRSKAHAEIASICLTYLLEPALLSPDADLSDYPFIRYASATWDEHYSRGDKALYHVESQVLRLFQDTAGSFDLWARSRDQLSPHIGEMATRLYYASLLGLESVLSEIIRGMTPLELSSALVIRAGLHGTALHAALIHRHERIARLLIEKGADLNEPCGSSGNALQAAAYGGSKTIVQFLLNKGVDVNAPCGRLGNALQVAASQRTSHPLVPLLLDYGAQINTQGGHWGTALQAASANRCLKTVKLLLDRGANVNAQGGFYGNALQAAATEGNEDIARLLLDHGATSENALHAAAVGGSLPIVKMLLERGADVNALDEHSTSALGGAKITGDKAMIELLIKNGAQLSSIEVAANL